MYELRRCFLCPILKRRSFHDKSYYSSKENTLGLPFKQWKLPAPNQGSEKKRQDIGIFAISIGEVYVGNRQGLLSWATTHWGQTPYTELNVLSNQNASKLLFSGVCEIAILPWLYELHMCCFSPLVQRGIDVTNLTSPEIRTCLGCLSSNENPCNIQGAREEEAVHWFICHNYRGCLVGNKACVDSWAKSHWCWCLFMELIILLKQEAPKLLFVEVLKWLFCPGCTK